MIKRINKINEDKLKKNNKQPESHMYIKNDINIEDNNKDQKQKEDKNEDLKEEVDNIKVEKLKEVKNPFNKLLNMESN